MTDSKEIESATDHNKDIDPVIGLVVSDDVTESTEFDSKESAMVPAKPKEVESKIVHKTLAEQFSDTDLTEDHWRESGKQVRPMRLIVQSIIGVLSVFMFSMGVFSIFLLWSTNEEIVADSGEKDLKKVEVLSEKEKDELDSKEVVENYLKAKTIDEKIKFIYNGRALRDVIAEGKSERKLRPGDEITPVRSEPIPKESKTVRAVFIDYGQVGEEFYVRKDDSGKWKLDWEARYPDESKEFAKFIKTKSTEAQSFRLASTITRSCYYNWGFTEAEYVAVLLRVPGSNINNWGFIPRENRALIAKYRDFHIRSQKHFEKYNVDRNRVILKVHFLPDSNPLNKRCFVIDSLESECWVKEDQN